MEDNKLMTTVPQKGAFDPGDWNDIENIGQRVHHEMMEYLKNISSKPGRNKPVEISKEKLEQSFCCN
jgi:hypothetical protein